MVQGEKVYSFSQLADKITKSKKGEAELAPHTIARFLSSIKIGIRLYETTIIIINSNDTYELYTDGHVTQLTKDRLNGFSPALIKTSKGILSICTGGQCYPFFEGIQVSKYGTIIGCNNGTLCKLSATKKPSKSISVTKKSTSSGTRRS